MIRPSHRGTRSGRFPERAGRLRQPVADRRGLVVDVVDARRAALDRDRGRLGGVLDVDEGPDAAAATHDRELATPDRLDVLAAGRVEAERRAGPVEAAVPEHEPSIGAAP